jgi:hypothetical protein
MVEVAQEAYAPSHRGYSEEEVPGIVDRFELQQVPFTAGHATATLLS